MSESLRPCPFCGGPAKIAETACYLAVGCEDCGVYIENAKSKRPHIIAAWNRRSTSERERLVEKVVEAAKSHSAGIGYVGSEPRHQRLKAVLAALQAHDAKEKP